VAEVRPESVKKKLKDKAFARSVNRDDIRTGAEEVGIPLEDLVVLVRDALAARAEDLGL
jgi:predicted hydrolase (HD superfamily)